MESIIVPDTPMSVLELFSTSKESNKLFAGKAVLAVKEGKADPLRLHVLCKSIEDVTTMIKEGIKANVTREAEKYGDKPFMFSGAECHLTAVKTEYDYEACGDPELVNLELQMKELKMKLDQRKEWLKTMGGPQDIRIGDELVTIYPPIKKTTTGVKVSIK